MADGTKCMKGSHPTAYGKSGNDKDIIEVNFEIANNKGTLSFSLNGQDLGILCSDLDPPLYPTAQIYTKDEQQMSLVS